MDQPAHAASDDIAITDAVVEAVPEHDTLGELRDAMADVRAERTLLRTRLEQSEARTRAVENKLKQSLMHLVRAEGVRAERDSLREEVVGLRRRLAGMRALESERDALRARLEGSDRADDDAAGEEPTEKLSAALSYLVRAEAIRTEREELHAQLSALEDENERLREEVARLGHPSNQRRARWSRAARSV